MYILMNEQACEYFGTKSEQCLISLDWVTQFLFQVHGLEQIVLYSDVVVLQHSVYYCARPYSSCNNPNTVMIVSRL